LGRKILKLVNTNKSEKNSPTVRKGSRWYEEKCVENIKFKPKANERDQGNFGKGWGRVAPVYGIWKITYKVS